MAEDASTSAPAASAGELADVMSGLAVEDKVGLIRSFAEEITTEAELKTLLEKKPNPVAYDGFEPSGRMHIAQGVMKALNVNKLAKCGVTFKFWVADWFAQLNMKMGGDLKKIRVVGEYMIEIWKAVGMNLDMVEFLWASDEINARPAEYWTLVMDIAMKNSLARITRCSQIMGRDDSDLKASQIFYPCMQCADIFFLKVVRGMLGFTSVIASTNLASMAEAHPRILLPSACKNHPALQADICQLGLDQRKVNMLAREYCDAVKRKLKPIIVSHPMMPGLKEGQEKMSKSDPDSAIFMEDTEQEVKTKIKKAFCPPQQVDPNPCIAYVRFIILPWFGKLCVERSEENGGNKEYESMESLENDYTSGALHPGDLKASLTRQLNEILQPVRDHFSNDKNAASLLKRVKAFKTTR